MFDARILVGASLGADRMLNREQQTDLPTMYPVVVLSSAKRKMLGTICVPMMVEMRGQPVPSAPEPVYKYKRRSVRDVLRFAEGFISTKTTVGEHHNHN